jgi:hypothetical protein
MSYLRFASIVLMCVLCVSLCLGQQAAPQMTNNDVIELVKMGLSEGLILDKINSSDTTGFDTSIPGLKALKAAKVSDNIIRTMMSPHPAAGAAAAPGTPQEAVSADPDNPASPHDPGIYMYIKQNGVPKMILVEPTFYSQGKTGGFLASSMTYGLAKIKTKAVVPGPHASLTTSDSGVAFYFYFEATGAKSFGGSSTPSEYTLVKFDVTKNTRETVTGQMNVLGSSHGTDEKANTGFNSTKLKPGVFKVIPSAPLAPGEYCFLYSTGEAGTAAAHRLYAFGIAPPE